MTDSEILTVGDIARKLNCPIHRIQYLIASRNIKPIQYVGGYRVFSNDILEKLRDENKKQKSKRKKR